MHGAVVAGLSPNHGSCKVRIVQTSTRDLLLSAYLGLRAELLRFLTARLGQPSTAEDVYQELFLRLQVARLPQEIANPRAFLFKLAFNLANDASRDRRRRDLREQAWADTAIAHVGSEAVLDQPAADEALEAKQSLSILSSAINTLPPRCREVFKLHRLRGMTVRDAAAVLGITPKAVEKQMTAALKHLAAALDRRRLQ